MAIPPSPGTIAKVGLGGAAAYSDKRVTDAESLVNRELGKHATTLKGEQVMQAGRMAGHKANLGTHKSKIDKEKQRGIEGVKGRRGGERGAMASVMGTTPTTEGTRVSEFAANFKDPKTQFQAANAGSAFAAEMDKASKEQSAFNEQLAAYGGMNQGYQDLGQSNRMRSGEIAANMAGGAEDQAAIGTDAALAHRAPDHELRQFEDRNNRFNKQMYDKYYSLRDHPDFGGLNPDDKAPMLGVPRRIKGSTLGAIASAGAGILGGLGF
tara:strand:- start:8700 stop:9500 length:801 start_codon:yes stop_codon:yes gene_type:complete